MKHTLTDCLAPEILSLFSEVVFSVRLDDERTYDTNDKVIFDYVISNVGNAYDNVTGIFTAPYDGTYELTLTNIGLGKTVTNIMWPGGWLCQAYAKEINVLGKFKLFHAILLLNTKISVKSATAGSYCMIIIRNMHTFYRYVYHKTEPC